MTDIVEGGMFDNAGLSDILSESVRSPEIKSNVQNNDLRTRLIDVLNVHGVELDDCYCDCGRDCFDRTGESLTDYVEHVADAVIEALADDIRTNGTWAMIDLLIELAGPRCFAEDEPRTTKLAKSQAGHQIVAAKTRSNGEASLVCQCGWESEWSKSDSKIHTDHSLHLIERR